LSKIQQNEMLQQCQQLFVAISLGCVSSPLMSEETLASETKSKYIIFVIVSFVTLHL